MATIAAQVATVALECVPVTDVEVDMEMVNHVLTTVTATVIIANVIIVEAAVEREATGFKIIDEFRRFFRTKLT